MCFYQCSLCSLEICWQNCIRSTIWKMYGGQPSFGTVLFYSNICSTSYFNICQLIVRAGGCCYPASTRSQYLHEQVLQGTWLGDQKGKNIPRKVCRWEMSVAQQGLQHSYWTGPGLDIQEDSGVRGNVFLNNSCWFAFSFSSSQGCSVLVAWRNLRTMLQLLESCLQLEGTCLVPCLPKTENCILENKNKTRRYFRSFFALLLRCNNL